MGKDELKMRCFFCTEKMILDGTSGLWECPLCKVIINTLNMQKDNKRDIERD